MKLCRKGRYLKNHGLTLSLGNLKLYQSVLVFNLPAIATCPNSSLCEDTCYAVRPQLRWPACAQSRTRNLMETLSDTFILRMVETIRFGVEKHGVTSVRIHESGDFYGLSYAKDWDTIITIVQCIHRIPFFAYTKSHFKPEKANIVESILPGGELNYGSFEDMIALSKKYKAVICPYNLAKIDFKCGKECTACQTKKYVLFVQH